VLSRVQHTNVDVEQITNGVYLGSRPDAPSGYSCGCLEDICNEDTGCSVIEGILDDGISIELDFCRYIAGRSHAASIARPKLKRREIRARVRKSERQPLAPARRCPNFPSHDAAGHKYAYCALVVLFIVEFIGFIVWWAYGLDLPGTIAVAICKCILIVGSVRLAKSRMLGALPKMVSR
jgi:hypothetical protein